MLHAAAKCCRNLCDTDLVCIQCCAFCGCAVLGSTDRLLHSFLFLLFFSFSTFNENGYLCAGILLIDRVGRRPLLLTGSGGCAVCMFSLAAAVWLMSPLWTLASMCGYILLFSACWAGVFWVVCSEVFSMSIKSPGMALSAASLFLSGAVTDFFFPVLLSQLQGGAFVAYGVLAALGGIYVFWAVPETKGLSLQDVQAALQQAISSKGVGV